VEFFIPDMTLFEKKKLSTLFSRFLTFWDHETPFQRLKSSPKIKKKSYLVFIWLSNNDSAPFFGDRKKVKYWRWIGYRFCTHSPSGRKGKGVWLFWSPQDWLDQNVSYTFLLKILWNKKLFCEAFFYFNKFFCSRHSELIFVHYEIL
jgi:hypothetical protein